MEGEKEKTDRRSIRDFSQLPVLDFFTMSFFNFRITFTMSIILKFTSHGLLYTNDTQYAKGLALMILSLCLPPPCSFFILMLLVSQCCGYVIDRRSFLRSLPCRLYSLLPFVPQKRVQKIVLHFMPLDTVHLPIYRHLSPDSSF